MIDAMDGLMTIGEFAARCGLSPKVLRTYADMGVLVPSAVDPGSAYRYYHSEQLAEAAIVALLRRAGVPVADIAKFLEGPSSDALEGWEQSLRAEVHVRRDALSEVRVRLGMGRARTRGVTMVDIRMVEDREELRAAFDLAGAQLPEPITSSDFRLDDLEARFPADRPIMLRAMAEGRDVGAALAFRTDDGWATLRVIGVVAEFRHRGIARRLVERIESEARILGVEGIALGTGNVVGFWFHLGYTPNLLFQWVYSADHYEGESRSLLDGPLSGLHHWRSSFNGVPQLFVELDEPRLDLLATLREQVAGCHVGFMMSKKLRQPVPR